MRFSPGCSCCGSVGCAACVGSPVPGTVYLTIAGAFGICAVLNGSHALAFTGFGFSWRGAISASDFCDNNFGTYYEAVVTCGNDGSGQASFSLSFVRTPGGAGTSIGVLTLESCDPLVLSGAGDASHAFCTNQEVACLVDATYTVTT